MLFGAAPKTRIYGAYLDKERDVQLATMEDRHSWRSYCIMQPENQDEVEVRQVKSGMPWLSARQKLSNYARLQRTLSGHGLA